MLGTRVLDDAGERFLHDAVERGRDVVGKLLVAKVRGEGGGYPGPRAPRLGQPFERGDEPEVVEGFRAQLDREPTHIGQRVRGQLAQTSYRRVDILDVRLSLEATQTEHDRGQRLTCLVMELACQPPSLELLGGDDAAGAHLVQRARRD